MQSEAWSHSLEHGASGTRKPAAPVRGTDARSRPPRGSPPARPQSEASRKRMAPTDTGRWPQTSTAAASARSTHAGCASTGSQTPVRVPLSGLPIHLPMSASRLPDPLSALCRRRTERFDDDYEASSCCRIQFPVTPTCPFCEPARDRIFHEDPLAMALWHGFPVSPGHALIVPRRHVPTWFDASAEEQAAILRTIDRVRQEILLRYQPDGFNIAAIFAFKEPAPMPPETRCSCSAHPGNNSSGTLICRNSH